ncbi:MAG: TlyA family RNA methyltransferase [Cellulomonadaceae bacterium]|jgi:23S rRNA (cytidine1920-2'-O)/16S rRNA (cytidine1409-2'-O)-methyltransferase|nr:TlyA family RNA methyltransferase [Cellulomonadaceae bacterium]
MSEERGPQRLDAAMVERGLARSRGKAHAHVKNGRVTVNSSVVTKPSTLVECDDDIAVTEDPLDANYASRAGTKLACVLDELSDDKATTVRVRGAWCVDLGASTGGFTDVLLRRGAEHVVALDVGHAQLLDRLREDPHVTVMEGVNVRDVTEADFAQPADVIVGDLSFISLTYVIPVVVKLLARDGLALLLIKPQFEVGKDRLGSGGVVRDPALHQWAIDKVTACAVKYGLNPRRVTPSALPGSTGNQEFFILLDRSQQTPD